MSPRSTRIIGAVLVVIIAGLGVFSFMQYNARMQVEQMLADTPGFVPVGEGEEVPSGPVLDRLRRHITLPTDVQPTVALIQDIDALKLRNSFYSVAKNGDYLIVTPSRAILYNAERDVILDIVPVQLQAEGARSISASAPASTGSVTN